MPPGKWHWIEGSHRESTKHEAGSTLHAAGCTLHAAVALSSVESWAKQSHEDSE
jgi:hypothetical protein